MRASKDAQRAKSSIFWGTVKQVSNLGTKYDNANAKVHKTRNLGDWTMSAHELLGNAAKILVIVHVLAALKHQFLDKNGLLSRMQPM